MRKPDNIDRFLEDMLSVEFVLALAGTAVEVWGVYLDRPALAWTGCCLYIASAATFGLTALVWVMAELWTGEDI